MNLSIVLGLVFMAVIFALSYAAINYISLKKVKEGNEEMQEIAKAIRLGADTFISYEYKVISIIAAIIAAVLAIFISWQTAIAFLIGAVMSGIAGFVGMKAATYANVRVTNTAQETKKLGGTLKVAFKGGSVVGLSVGGFALLGIFIVYLVFGVAFGQIKEIVDNAIQPNWIGFSAPFTMTVSGYALGCSIIAMFARVGGGIYTKAADMGADLVGKTEANIPEDDPRNPATIADNVGDNVGDVAGLGADLLESYVGALLSSVILAVEIFRNNASALLDNFTTDFLKALITYPLAFGALGLISCVIGIGTLLLKRKISENAHIELNLATWISAGLTAIFAGILSYIQFKSYGSADLEAINFRFGFISPWLSAIMGIAAGIIIGLIAEYYTSYDYKPTKEIANSSVEGAALTITEGMAVGMKSTMFPVVVLGSAILISFLISGMYGVAMAAIGMLSFVATTVSVDAYGPIADNAGGIAEMSGLDLSVRQITDKLDSVGNTTAAIGKGFAIGSAALAALSMMVSYLYSYSDNAEPLLNLVSPITLVGVLIGGALPFMFSGMLIKAVSKAARKMVDEVRRQFREIIGLLEGKAKPDYKTCVEISSRGALKEMIVPALISILFPVVSGFLFGPNFVGGLLIGATLSAVMLAIYTGNAGGAWDNAKKYIESGGIPGQVKGSAAHNAAIVGDTVGDPLKDTVGPSLDILIKIMSVVSIITVVVFSKYNLYDFIVKLFSK